MSFSRKPKTINIDEVDPSVYYYDEVYDEMKDEAKSIDDHGKVRDSKGTKTPSKYIQGLKETAELRKAEKELRTYKRYARDREEAKLDRQDDDEVYITDAYKQKLKDIKRLEAEKEKRLHDEKDNLMNFLNKPKPSKSSSVKVVSDDSMPQTSSKMNESETSERVGSDAPIPTAEVISDKSNAPESRTRRKKLVTPEERKAFLQELLAKRTVGKVYEDALERYIVRKTNNFR